MNAISKRLGIGDTLLQNAAMALDAYVVRRVRPPGLILDKSPYYFGDRMNHPVSDRQAGRLSAQARQQVLDLRRAHSLSQVAMMTGLPLAP